MLESDSPLAGHFFVTWLLEMIFPVSQIEKTSYLLLLIFFGAILAYGEILNVTYRPKEDPVEITFVSVELESKPSGIPNSVGRASKSRSSGKAQEKRCFVVLWVGLLLEKVGASVVFDFITGHFKSSISTSPFGVTKSKTIVNIAFCSYSGSKISCYLSGIRSCAKWES